jgi:hypothetical protein
MMLYDTVTLSDVLIYAAFMTLVVLWCGKIDARKGGK